MSEQLGDKKKKELIKQIIKELHQGLPPEKAKEKIQKEVGTLTSAEITAVEQSLIDEGMPPEEIKEFCNVHALLFESVLKESATEMGSPSHPVNLFKKENREIEKLVSGTRRAKEDSEKQTLDEAVKSFTELLRRFEDIEYHYQRKEQLLFPYLEKHEFYGPSKVMWGKHDEVRAFMKKAAAELPGCSTQDEFDKLYSGVIDPLLSEAEGMVTKEEQILFPAALEKLEDDEWLDILKNSYEAGYGFGVEPPETEQAARELKSLNVIEPDIAEDGSVIFPSGKISLTELMSLLNTLPIDITYIDKDDRVAYFSENKERIFLRTRSIIGREVKNCHPPASVDRVEMILRSFKERRRDWEEFWIEMDGRFIYIQFFAVRDQVGTYLGCVEITQDLTHVRGLTGEKRLLDTPE